MCLLSASPLPTPSSSGCRAGPSGCPSPGDSRGGLGREDHRDAGVRLRVEETSRRSWVRQGGVVPRGPGAKGLRTRLCGPSGLGRVRVGGGARTELRRPRRPFPRPTRPRPLRVRHRCAPQATDASQPGDPSARGTRRHDCPWVLHPTLRRPAPPPRKDPAARQPKALHHLRAVRDVAKTLRLLFLLA